MPAFIASSVNLRRLYAIHRAAHGNAGTSARVDYVHGVLNTVISHIGAPGMYQVIA